MLSSTESDKINVMTLFSTYSMLIRFFAILIRFKNFKLRGEEYKNPVLTFSEINNAETLFLISLQREMFNSIDDPKLKTLDVFVDTDGLIRLKTKIVELQDNYSLLYPIVLDRQHDAIYLMIRETHESLNHAGIDTVMVHFRERIWILQARRVIRTVISKCIICKKLCTKPIQVPPTSLPKFRIQHTTVFEITVVDFAGPLYLKDGSKGWICLFTCAVYRAVHLELVG